MARETELWVKKYKSEGDLAHQYQPFRNKLSDDGTLEAFETDEIDFNLNKPVNIECQPSYDGTVNLIINDDLNPPRIINSTYSVIEDNRYKRIVRNQTEQTNIYKKGEIDSRTRLFRTIKTIPQINLLKIEYHGQLMVGNYTFYFKFADNDYNKTDVIAESGLVSIFKGTIERINTISGGLVDERTEKAINLSLTNIDTSFSKLFIYYKRDSSDLNGIIKSNTYKILKPYKITSSIMSIVIDGYEDVEEINQEELNIKYNICTGVKTQAQVQNMLFFGNIQQIIINNKELQNLSYFIEAQEIQKETSIGYIDPQTYTKQKTDNIGQTEYYNPLQIYYSLGYWPEEIYRFGIVYIFIDDSLSPVYNLRGCKFSNENKQNFEYDEVYKENSLNSYWKNKEKREINYIPKDNFYLYGASYLTNTKGVFEFSNLSIYNIEEKEIHPIGIQFNIPKEIIDELKNTYKIKGFFFVRQKRIPTTLAQGFTIGIDRVSYIPMLYDAEMYKKNNNTQILNPQKGCYITESFIDKNEILSTDFSDRILTTTSKQSSGLLCLDAMVNSQFQSIFDNSEFILKGYKSFNSKRVESNKRVYYITTENKETNIEINGYSNTKILYVNTDIPLKYVDNYGYCTRAGSAEDVKDFKFFADKNYNKSNQNLIRGTYCSFLGTNSNLLDNTLYNIKISNYSTSYESKYFEIRGNDNSPFMSISPRYNINDNLLILNTISETRTVYQVPEVYRGDCFTSTVTIRINTNFIDPELPVNELIVDPNTWKDGYKGYNETSSEDWKDINRADVNSVPMGMWITYKCLSNFNLGLRSENRQYIEEMALMGNPRSFYPLQGINTAPSCKIEESTILNQGYNTSLPFKKYFSAPDVPYVKELFDNRVMFSDVQVDDDFRNAYRIFQGLDYKDIERQYGAIVKLLSLGVNLFCVFEHGVAIIPINEKALISTTTGQSIHMYGAGVLQNQVSVISPDYGSIWQESIIRTPNGIYGVDTYAKKIWRYNQAQGFVLISDMTIQRFLNDNIELGELDKYPTVAYKNVKTHYNNYKGDVMFTFYNNNKVWNLCYNERLQKWITKYSWTPLYSENINNIFYSLDRERASILGTVYENQTCNYGIHINNRSVPTYWRPHYDDAESYNEFVSKNFLDCGNLWDYSDITRIITYRGLNFYNQFYCKIINIESKNKEESIYYDYVVNNDEDKSSILYADEKHTIPLIEITSTAKTTDSEGYNTIKIYRNNIFDKYYYLKINLNITPITFITDNGNVTFAYGPRLNDTAMFIRDINDYELRNPYNFGDIPEGITKDSYDDVMRNGFFVHGRAGIFDEINYFDQETTNQILPTKWYDKQEPFEFEFIVNTPQGIQKIFNNLVIISNNVEPNSLEFELIGDAYDFNKAGIFESDHLDKSNYYDVNEDFNQTAYDKDRYKIEFNNRQNSQDFKIDLFNDIIKYNTTIIKDPILEQYSLQVTDNCRNIKSIGRKLGNIEYKEDRWLLTITPIYFKNKYISQYDVEENYNGVITSNINSTRIRDKWIKVRLKYTGEKLVVINAIQTLMNISYA